VAQQENVAQLRSWDYAAEWIDHKRLLEIEMTSTSPPLAMCRWRFSSRTQ